MRKTWCSSPNKFVFSQRKGRGWFHENITSDIALLTWSESRTHDCEMALICENLSLQTVAIFWASHCLCNLFCQKGYPLSFESNSFLFLAVELQICSNRTRLGQQCHFEWSAPGRSSEISSGGQYWHKHDWFNSGCKVIFSNSLSRLIDIYFLLARSVRCQADRWWE